MMLLTMFALLEAAANPPLTPDDIPLPPILAWQGASERVVTEPTDPWITPAEASSFRLTATAAETHAYIQRLCQASPWVSMSTLGHSASGRPIYLVKVSKDPAFHLDGGRREREKAILLVQAGIHAGEIDGKDATMMWVRDAVISRDKASLLDHCDLLWIPVVNVDGHERPGRFQRVNQRGPENAGWRTNDENLNLNRDYAKLDSAEMRVVIRALRRWDPDLYVDIHVTDGADYQYDITYGFNGVHSYSPSISRWLNDTLRPRVDAGMKAMGHIPGPLVFMVNRGDPGQGIADWTATPRYSNGYGDVCHLPTILVENHSLKPFRQRVLGTYVFIEQVMTVLGKEVKRLRAAVKEDETRHMKDVPLTWAYAPESETMEFLGVSFERALSPITGAEEISWTGELQTLRVPVHIQSRPEISVKRPAAYLIPPAWSSLAHILERHGIQGEILETEAARDVECLELSACEWAERPYEGRFQVQCEIKSTRTQKSIPPGTFRVPTDQPLGDLAICLLEPQSPDSLFSWGFMHSITQRTEYMEAYVLEPIARQMLENEPAIKQAFEAWLQTDPQREPDARERLMWFYQRTPFVDRSINQYPILRELNR